MIAACLAIVFLAALLAYRERIHAQERSELYQRIQAPQMAVMEHAEAQPTLSIAYDDDEAFWSATEDRRVS